jgi:HK97 family phage prohead protease
MSDLITRAAALRFVSGDERAVDVLASSDTLDAHGTIVEQDWELDEFRANPVVFYNHEHGELPIGRAEDIRLEDGALQMRVRFASAEANPRAEQAYRLMREGVLRGVSVGFVPGDVRLEKRDGRDVLVLSRNRLFELSVTPLPSNPDALARLHARARTAPPGETMNDVSTVLTALGLAGGATDEQVRARVEPLVAFERSVLEALGCAPADAVARIDALRAAAERATGLEKDLGELKAAVEKREQAAALAELDAVPGVTPAVRARYAEKSAAEIRAFAGALRDVLAGAKAGVEPKDPPKEPAPATDWQGKKFEQMAPIERHRLHQENPELYAALRADAEKRGAL